MIAPNLLTIRLSTGEPADSERIRHLAGLDGARAPEGLVLMAELDGEPVAAIGFACGDEVADPARSDNAVMSLLRLYRLGIRGIATVWGA
jgi:hypothetical protein